MNKIIPLLIISLIILLIAPLRVFASTIADGELIRVQDELDVYIVKLVGEKKFKRLILTPEIFNQYAHLKWENIKDITQPELDEYTTSDLVRALGDEKVYKLYPYTKDFGEGVYPNGDVGEKRWVKTADDFLNLGYDWDAIYTINNFERDYYLSGSDLEAPQKPEEPVVPPRGSITINVPGDYSTIQTAIDVAINGDTIAVDPGTYKENIVINKNIKLIGNHLATTIDGDGKEPAITINGATDFLIQKFTIKSKSEKAIYCSGENLSKGEIKNTILTDSDWGIFSEGNCSLTILNNVIYNNRNSTNTDGAGILVKNNTSYEISIEVRNNTIDDNYHGIWSENANLKIMNSIITNNIGGNNSTGIYHSNGGEIITMYNNVWHNGFDYGGDAVPGSGTLVVDPEFSDRSHHDYRLKWGETQYSKCIDAGHSDYIYNDGKLFTSNIYRNDMGAYGGPDNITWEEY